jgi:hypothetical protein
MYSVGMESSKQDCVSKCKEEVAFKDLNQNLLSLVLNISKFIYKV